MAAIAIVFARKVCSDGRGGPRPRVPRIPILPIIDRNANGYSAVRQNDPSRIAVDISLRSGWFADENRVRILLHPVQKKLRRGPRAAAHQYEQLPRLIDSRFQQAHLKRL